MQWSPDDILDYDYFPDCVLPKCTLSNDCLTKLPEPRTDIHQHILPLQRSILDSTAKYLFCQSGVGASKSVGFAAKCVKLSLQIPNNEGPVCRLQLKDAYKSSWRDVKACIKRLVQRGKITEPKMTARTQGDYSQITFYETSSIMYCIPGHNWSDALGPSYGWFWVDDCMEAFEELFVGDDNSAGLISRLRLPHVHFDKHTYDEDQREHGSLHGMVSTNPPPIGHWSHKLFGDKPGFYYLGEDSVEWLLGSTIDNPFTGLSYAKGLIAVQRRLGKSENTIRRVVFGESIPAYGGVPVFGNQFDIKKHVASLKYMPDLPIIRSWDFGYAHPAVIFAHIYKCKYRTNHYFTLSEVAEAFSLTVYDLWKYHVKEHTERLYKDCCWIADCGDRAGYRASTANRDGRSDMKILISEYQLSFRYKSMLLEPSLQYMRSLLKPKEPCLCGMELVLIDRSCQVLIGALEGGYKYPKKRNNPHGDKPIEDKYFADVACAWRYGAENYVKVGLDWQEQKYIKQRTRGTFNGQPHEWEWMNQEQDNLVDILTGDD
jgi:hypothetical protein